MLVIWSQQKGRGWGKGKQDGKSKIIKYGWKEGSIFSRMRIFFFREKQENMGRDVGQFVDGMIRK